MDINSISNSQIDIQSLLNAANKTNGVNNNDSTSKTGYYAKKGEPMYMKDMDSDDDGTVTLDEFRDYCKSKNISTREMVKMSQIASSFRVMAAEENTIDYISKLTPNVFPKLKQAESESGYLRQSENQYNISNDPAKSNKVSYKEYMEYCQQNAVTGDLKSNAKVEESDDGNFKISNHGKALKLYKDTEGSFVKSTFENAV